VNEVLKLPDWFAVVVVSRVGPPWVFAEMGPTCEFAKSRIGRYK
jgi:hypothetical protein